MRRLQTDVLVVGAGPAGIAAAVSSRSSNAGVIVVDGNIAAGGQIWRGSGANFWVRRFRRSGAQLLTGAQVIACDGDTLVVDRSPDTLAIGYRKLILANGARELFLPFPGWTLPGVMGVGGLQAMVKGGMPIRGKRVVVAGSGPLLLAVAAHLRQAGANVSLIAEQAPNGRIMRFASRLALKPGKLLQAAALRATLLGVPYRTGCWVERADGPGRLSTVHLRSADKTWTEPCDFAAVSYGLCPNTELAALLGCGTDPVTGVAVDENQQTTREGIYAAGECTGIGGVDLSLAEGQIAGLVACGTLDQARYLLRTRARARRFADQITGAFALRHELRRLAEPDTVICRCEDVRYAGIETMPSFRAAKLQVRCGMGPCQGRVCGPICRFLFGWSTTGDVRPPLYPSSLGSLIGTHL